MDRERCEFVGNILNSLVYLGVVVYVLSVNDSNDADGSYRRVWESVSVKHCDTMSSSRYTITFVHYAEARLGDLQ